MTPLCMDHYFTIKAELVEVKSFKTIEMPTKQVLNGEQFYTC